jgi:phospholipid/cholesterol/gamma-HCH transport system substrate-binding protein
MAVRLLDKQTIGDLTKLTIFIVVTTVCTSVLVLTIGNISFGGTKEYSAEFSEVTGLVKGDDIRVAGVRVGNVSDIEIVDGRHAQVTFAVNEGTQLTEATHATIRYRNLVGQRYVSLSQASGSSDLLEEGDTIPLEQTKPSLDLTVLFNGFKPLFEALSPDDVNKLSYEIIQVFQGQGGTLESLLGHTASLTTTLANRDALLGDLIENLDFVLDHVADRDKQLAELISSFRQLVTGLKNDRHAILNSLDGISDLSVETAGLLREVRPALVADIKQARRLADNLERGKAEIDRTLQVAPIKLRRVSRTTIYGSFPNFYLCYFRGTVTLPDLAGTGSPVFGILTTSTAS